MTQRVPRTAEHAKNLFLERAAENAPYGSLWKNYWKNTK